MCAGDLTCTGGAHLCTWQDAFSCVGEIDRRWLASCGSCVRSHPPVLDALTALRPQDNRPGAAVLGRVLYKLALFDPRIMQGKSAPPKLKICRLVHFPLIAWRGDEPDCLFRRRTARLQRAQRRSNGSDGILVVQGSERAYLGRESGLSAGGSGWFCPAAQLHVARIRLASRIRRVPVSTN